MPSQLVGKHHDTIMPVHCANDTFLSPLIVPSASINTRYEAANRKFKVAIRTIATYICNTRGQQKKYIVEEEM